MSPSSASASARVQGKVTFQLCALASAGAEGRVRSFMTPPLNLWRMEGKRPLQLPNANFFAGAPLAKGEAAGSRHGLRVPLSAIAHRVRRPPTAAERSEERRVGYECVVTCRSRMSPNP